MNQHFISADWPAPDGVTAFSTTRAGGFSTGEFSSLNLGLHVGDDPAVVAANRALLQDFLPENSAVQWLSQVHGTQIVHARVSGDCPEADACWTDVPGQACAVMSADCLPVLLCNIQGTVVAAAHAGWRGLLSGVLEETVGAMNGNNEELLAWMGPAIGPGAFEIGSEVKSGFMDAATNNSLDAVNRCFTKSFKNTQCYMADLYGLARLRLNQVVVSRVYGGGLCTYSDTDRFFSYRRDGETGRIASLICIKPN